jgi:uncharacterized protein (TIGR00255 family)
MTAFRRETASGGDREITVEIKSVNSRYLDWSIRLPRSLGALEERIKAALTAAGVSRGKVDVTVTLSAPAAGDSVPPLELDMDCARQYAAAAAALCQALPGVDNDLTVSRLLALPGVMVPVKEEAVSSEEAEEVAWALISPVLSRAAQGFLADRSREGSRLQADLVAKLADIRVMARTLADRSESNIRTFHDRFEERLRGIMRTAGVAVDEGLLLTECALYADRIAVDEELVRLASHFDTLDSLFAAEGPVGRKIDFLLQETNREVNTIGSKCADADMARTVAEIKSELEKIREQIQNIE